MLKSSQCKIGDRLGFTNGALLHDIGKIYIASDILNKTGKITNLEYQLLQTHAEYSYKIAKEKEIPESDLDHGISALRETRRFRYPNKLWLLKLSII